MSDDSLTLYERIGGASAVKDLIGEFYRRVLADGSLRHFFRETSIDKLTRMQEEFFAVALDGPTGSAQTDLTGTHHGLGITREHFTRFVDHLISVVEERHSIGRRDAMDIIYRVAMYSDEVIGESGGIGG